MENTMMENILELVDRICAMESTNCRGLNKSEEARKLLDIINVPNNAIISEIPLDWNRQVIVLFRIPADNNVYSLFSGIGNNGKFYFELTIDGTFQNDGTFVDYFGNGEILPIDYFKENMHMCKIRNKRIRNILTEECEVSEEELKHTTKREALEKILEYEGIIGYTNWIIDLVQDIYNVNLENSPT